MNLGLFRASVSFGLLAALACSSNGTARGAGPGATPGGGSGTGGTGVVLGSGGGGNAVNLPAAGNGTVMIPGGGGDFVVPDDDPTNPNITHPKCGKGACTDFPEAPILGEGVPANAPTLFGDPGNMTAGSFCVLEPQLSSGATPGAMIPANWVRPRIKFTPPAGTDLFEIRIKNDAQKNELVAYTTKTTWYVPKEIWAGTGAMIAAGNGAANNGAGAPFTVTIRAVNSASPGMPVGVTGDFNVAPVVATGSMVFWTVNSAMVTPDSSKLMGFAVGDEGIQNSLSLTNVSWKGQISDDGSVLRGYYDDPKLAGFTDGQVRCIGCHTSTPDGTAVIFTDDWPWEKAAASLTMSTVGTIPTFISPGAQALMKMTWWGTQTMSKAHWTTGDRILVTSIGMNTMDGKTRKADEMGWFKLNYPEDKTQPLPKIKQHQLAWIDLETTATVNATVTDEPDYGEALSNRQKQANAAMGTGWGTIATGDTLSAVNPSFSHDGTKIVYTVTDYSPDGHPDYTAKVADIKTVAYSKTGGTGMPLPGASDPNLLEYYPSYSADDKFIAFTQAPAVSASSPDGPYYNRNGKIMIIPADGGTATPLAANEPNACAGDPPGQGVINSWPKWSPEVFVAHGKTYYFLIFSSARKYSDEFSEQFMLPKSNLSSFTGLALSSQLWLAAVVVDNASGQITTYPAVYVWNQNRLATGTGAGMATKFSNLTPAWDPFQLPPIVIEDVPSDVPR